MKKDDTFASARLLYRGIQESDASLLVKWRSDATIIRYYRFSEPLTLEKHLLWYHGYLTDPERFDYIIRTKKEGIPIGFVGVNHVSDCKKECEIGYTIGERQFWKMGFGREAVVSLIEHVHQKLNIEQFIAEVHQDNEASIRLVTDLGFHCETQEGDFYKLRYILKEVNHHADCDSHEKHLEP